MTVYWLTTGAHTAVQDGLIAAVALAYVAIARDIAREVRGL